MIALPFNNNPSSIEMKTAGYTIPDGYHAHISAQVVQGGTITIDGVLWLRSYASAQTAVSVVATAVSGYTVPSGQVFRGVAGIVGSGVCKLHDTNGLPLSGYVELGEGTIIYMNGSSVANAGFLQGYVTPNVETKPEIAVGNQWFPEGTVITVAGTVNYAVALFEH